MDRLPAEVLFQILECISQDETTSTLDKLPCFHSISLTCKLLSNVTRPYLYQPVYLDGMNHSHGLMTALGMEPSIGQYTRDVFLDESRDSWPAEEVVPFATLYFPKAVEVAWTEVDKDGLCHGHHYSKSRTRPAFVEQEQDCFIEVYHALLPSLHWNYFSLLFSCDISKLTHITITVRKL